MSETTGNVNSHRDRTDLVGRWIASDPVRIAAIALVAAAVLIRVQIATRGFLAEDDFVLANRAQASDFSLGFLLAMYNNHLAPGIQAIFWVVTRAVGLEYWPYVLIFAVAQTALGISFFRLLRLLTRPGWAQLIPLAILMFSPLTLDTTSMLTVGLYFLPMELAAVWAIGAQVKYSRTRRPWHLVTLAAALLFGLAFYEKTLLVGPLVVLVTGYLLVPGGPVRNLVQTIRREWPGWAVLVGVSGLYLGLYLTRPAPPCNPLGCAPAFGWPTSSVGEVVKFIGQLVGTTLVPGLLGGPWRWVHTGDGPPLTDTPDVLRWLTWAVFLAVMVGTIVRRRVAVRAWVTLTAYIALVVGLFAVTRLGSPLSNLAGLVPHYIADIVVVAALCIGIAMLGLRDETEEAVRFLPDGLREPVVVATTLVLVFVAVLGYGIGTAMSTAKYGDAWAVKHGRDYLSTARAELIAAPEGTVFFDQPVPNEVVPGYIWPDALQSQFFRTVEPQPVFVTESANPSVFDSTGHIQPVQVVGVNSKPGPVKDCGYRVSDGKPTVIPLEGNAFPWTWAVRVGYLSSGTSTATFRLGNATHEFAFTAGLHNVYFFLEGDGGEVELTVKDPTINFCTNLVVVGKLATQP